MTWVMTDYPCATLPPRPGTCPALMAGRPGYAQPARRTYHAHRWLGRCAHTWRSGMQSDGQPAVCGSIPCARCSSHDLHQQVGSACNLWLATAFAGSTFHVRLTAFLFMATGFAEAWIICAEHCTLDSVLDTLEGDFAVHDRPRRLKQAMSGAGASCSNGT